MSTEYEVLGDLVAVESSAQIDLGLSTGMNCTGYMTLMRDIDENQMRKMIVNLVKIGSYISDDPEEFLQRFNVDYRDEV